MSLKREEDRKKEMRVIKDRVSKLEARAEERMSKVIVSKEAKEGELSLRVENEKLRRGLTQIER